MGNPADVIEEVKNSKHKKVQVAIADIDGVLRGKYIHKDKFLSVSDGSGFGFCNVIFGWDSADECYDNITYTGWHTGYPDANAKIDHGTYRNVPWNNDTPFFLADFYNAAGEGLEVCPRQVLRKVLKDAEGMGFDPYCGLEFEFFNFRENPQSIADKGFVNPNPITPGMFGYSLLRSSMNQDYFMALMDETEAFGVPLEGLHTETGPGVYEAAIQVAPALEAADRGVLFKSSVKEIAHRFGIIPSFMAKWNASLPGCSGHIHQSLLSRADGRNAFYDESAPHKMSETFKSYLAGQMLLLPEILPFLAPNINSYKRLVEGLWAPTRVAWAVDNRTAAFRVIPGSSKSTRLETRVGGSDMNPYLGVAAAIGAGLYGIRNKLKLDDPITGNAYAATDAVSLPKNLQEAALKLSESKIAPEIFGKGFVEHFVNSRLWEWRQFEAAVTSWETERYFEII